MVAVRIATASAVKYQPGSIHEAVSTCSLETVKALVDEGFRQEKLAERTYLSGIREPKPAAFVDDADERGIQPIHIAAGLTNPNWLPDQLALIEFLLENGADPNACDTEDGLSPLHIAAENNNVEVTEVLLANGADATIEDPRAQTALHLAASYGHTDTVKVLASKYPPCVMLHRCKGNTALHYAAAHGHIDTTMALLEGGARPHFKNNLGSTALHYAAGRGYTDIVELLIDYQGNLNEQQNDGSTALHFAAMEGHLDVLQVLVERGADLEMKTEKGSTALHCAAERGYMEILTALLDYGADVNAMQNSGNTPLMYAAAKGHDKVVMALLKAEADPNHASDTGRTPVHRAVASDNEPIVKILLEAGADLNQVSLSGETALFAAASQGNLKMVKCLLDNGAEVNGHVNTQGDTPLHLACTQGNREVVMALIDMGARLDVMNNEGCNPLQKGQYKLGDEIPNRLASFLNEDGRTILWCLVHEMTSTFHSPGRVEGLRVLISDMIDYESDVNASVDGVSVLDASLLPGGSFDYDVVKMLVDKGADCSKGYPLNRVVKELTMCRNPIDGTADLEREEFLLDCIDVLAAGGVDVNANAEGNTPLMLAITAGQARAVHRLASVGANIHDENIIGKLCRKLRTLSEEPGQERELQFLGQSIVTVIEAGADVNATWGNVYPKIRTGAARTLNDRYNGNSCIEHLMAAGNEAAAKALIFHGADLEAAHILNKCVEEMCEIDPAKIPFLEQHAPNPSAAHYGAGRMIFLEEVFHAMTAQPNVNLDDEFEHKTPLRRAIEDVHDDLPFGQAAVSALIKAGADVNKNHVFFFTVHELCKLQPPSGPRYEGLFKIVKMLVDAKADVNEPYENTTPLALSWNSGRQEVVQLLTLADAELGRSTLFDIMGGFLKDPNDAFTNNMANMIIQDIIDKRNKRREGGASLNYERDGKTPLILGIMARHEGLVLGETGILAAGADANIGAPFNFCLEELKKCEDEDRDFLEKVAMYLLEQEADVDSGAQHGFAQAVAARSYLAFIIIQDRKALHNDLFDVLNELIKTTDEEVKDYLERLVVSLVSAGIGTKMLGPNNETAFTLSIMANNLSFIDMLLEKKCNIHDGYPFHKALGEMPKAAGNPERVNFLNYTLEKLLSATDSINEIYENNTPLTCAILNDARTFTGQLLHRFELDANLCSPLVVALTQVNTIDQNELDDQADARLEFLYSVIYKLMEKLMESGATLESGGKSILIMGIDTGRVDLVKRMVDAQADVNYQRPLAHCLEVFDPSNPAWGNAAKRQDMEKMAMLLLENGANPNVPVGVEQEPALTIAARAGLSNLTKLLIRSHTDAAHFDDYDKEGKPALHRFLGWLQECNPDNLERVAFLEESLLELITCVNDESLNTLVDGQSPLDVALKSNNAPVCSALLKRGAAFGPSALVDTLKELNDPNLTPDRFMFLEATACELITNGADVNQGVAGSKPVELVFGAGSAPVLQKMLEHDLDTSCGPNGVSIAQYIGAEVTKEGISEHDKTFLGDAAVELAKKDPSVFHEIMDSTKTSTLSQVAALALRLIDEADVSFRAERGSDGATPLHCAASAGAGTVLRKLLSGDSNVNAVNKYNQTALIFAAMAGQMECVGHLLNARADASIAGGQYLKKMTPLHEAALAGDPDICKMLIDAGAPVDAAAYWNRTPLHLAVVGGSSGEESGRLPCVEVLLQGNCNVNAMDLDNETGLSYAVERDYQGISQLLLRKGADPCGVDIHGTTPIHHCVENHNNEIFQSLLSSRPHDVEVLGLLPPVIRAGFQPGIEPLAQPCGEVSTTQSIQGMLGSANIGGWLAPLWNACYFGQHGIAESFLGQLSDIDLKDHAGFTLLHRLVHWGGKQHISMIPTLLKRGASPDVRDRNNWTPLQVAVRLGNLAAAQALLQAGAVASEEDMKKSAENGDASAAVLRGGAPMQPSIDDRSSIDNVNSWCRQHSVKFVDPNFAPCLESLVDSKDSTMLPGRFHDVEWVRAGEACSGSFLGSFDVTAGPLGDPFFIATLPDNPADAFTSTEASDYGVYEVVVQYLGETHRVMVDDFVPAIDGKPISACSASGMMWPLIYEKACAKIAGSYQALSTLRHAEATLDTSTLPTLPERLNASDRRKHEVHKFVTPCVAAAKVGGFARSEESTGDFAKFFGDTPFPEKSMDGVSRPMTTVGNFDMMQYAIRAPSKIVKINTDTMVRAECSYSPSTAGTCLVALCIVEMTQEKWKLVKGSVSTHGQTSVVVDATLTASGNKYLVFVGTPVNKSGGEPTLDLEVLSDHEIAVTDA